MCKNLKILKRERERALIVPKEGDGGVRGEGCVVVIWAGRAPNARHSYGDLRASINPFLYFLVRVSNWYFAVGSSMQLVRSAKRERGRENRRSLQMVLTLGDQDCGSHYVYGTSIRFM